MKKNLALLAAAMLCTCCLGLAACGGSSSSSAASESASASASSESASASTASDSASASASAASSEASSSASDGVSPELKEAAENLAKLADEQTALVEKAKAEGGYDAVKADWDKLNSQVSDATNALQPWAMKFSDGTISEADKAYYMRVVTPAASKSARAGLDMLELMK